MVVWNCMHFSLFTSPQWRSRTVLIKIFGMLNRDTLIGLLGINFFEQQVSTYTYLALSTIREYMKRLSSTLFVLSRCCGNYQLASECQIVRLKQLSLLLYGRPFCIICSSQIWRRVGWKIWIYVAKSQCWKVKYLWHDKRQVQLESKTICRTSVFQTMSQL